MRIKNTFSLSLTTTKEFWDKVLYVEKWRSSGLGGSGALWIMTSEKLLYQIGFETFPYNENCLEAFSDFFAEDEFDRINYKRVYKIEKKGWKYLGSRPLGSSIWIKDEFVDEFLKRYKEASANHIFVFSPQIFAEIIGVKGEVERMVEEDLAKIIEERLRD